MNNEPERTAGSMSRIIDEYGDLLFRVCWSVLRNRCDAEDALQETLIAFFLEKRSFESAEHERAWLVRVAANKSKDLLRKREKRQTMPESAIGEAAAEDRHESPALDALMTLPEKYRLILMLHYVEGYKVRELSEMLDLRQSAIKMRLQKGRRLLAEAYKKENG